MAYCDTDKSVFARKLKILNGDHLNKTKCNHVRKWMHILYTIKCFMSIHCVYRYT